MQQNLLYFEWFESKHILYDRCFIALSITIIEILDVINQRTSPLDWRWHLLFINFNPKIHHQQYTYCSQRCFYFWYVLHLYLLIHCIPATLSFIIYPIIEKCYIGYILSTTIKILLHEFGFPWNCRNLNSYMSWCINIRLVYGLGKCILYIFSPT